MQTSYTELVSLRLVVITLCGCGATASPPAIENHAPPIEREGGRSACPVLTRDPSRDHDLWLSTAFPQCPPEPFEYSLWVCGTDCPKPCRVRVNGPGAGLGTVQYDADGHWIDTVAERVRGCSYKDGKVDRCWRHDPWSSQVELSVSWRGDHIEVVDSNHEHIALFYDHDRVARIDLHWVTVRPGGRTVGRVPTRIDFAYDARGRLIRERLTHPDDWIETTTYRYDEAGRVAARNNEDEDTTFTYRPDGRLVRVDTTLRNWFDESNHNMRQSLAFNYDDRGRLISKVDTFDDQVSTDTYDYDCR